MKIFHCGNCEQLVFFENSACVTCGHALAYLPDRAEMGALAPDPEREGLWLSQTHPALVRSYRLCRNYQLENVCNWAVPADDPDPYCQSCRLTRIIPNLNHPGAREAWARLESAKRRLMDTLFRLELTPPSKAQDPERGLSFEFLSDLDTPGAAPVLTGHADGVITINIAEADDAERERRRNAMGEEYRTLLGHFRHEVGHYYWDRLIRDKGRLDEFRALFGDERQDYAEALRRHHQQGAPPFWDQSYVSAYASSHPWEDWAETWAHYLHMTDTLETAVECGLSLRPKRSDEPTLQPDIAVVGRRPPPFDQLIARWFSLTYVLNNLNRGMGLPDAYPFVLSPPAVEKLRFVHKVVG